MERLEFLVKKRSSFMSMKYKADVKCWIFGGGEFKRQESRIWKVYL